MRAHVNAKNCCVQNGVGLVAAGGLGGWVYLQNGTRQKQAAEQEADKAEQRAKIESLSSQVGFSAVPTMVVISSQVESACLRILVN